MKKKIYITFILVFNICFNIVKAQGDSAYIVVSSISIKGNRVTKEKIILRELTFKQGDYISHSNIAIQTERSRQNLLNLSLFNFVTIERITKDSLHYDYFILLEERWYLWPNLTFDHAERNFSAWLQTRDFSRLDYGLGLRKENFRGRNETLQMDATFGYNTRYTLSYRNVFADKNRKHALGFALSYLENNAIDYKVENNKIMGFKVDAGNAIQTWKFSASYNYRRKLYNQHSILLDFKEVNIMDTILKLNSEFLGTSRSQLRFAYLTYQFAHDKRDSKYYPLVGLLYNGEIRQYGLGTPLEDNLSVTTIKAGLNYYTKLLPHVFWAGAIIANKSIADSYPFYLQKGMGFGKNFIRGYEYYVLDGYDYAHIKTNFKYELLSTRVSRLAFLFFKKFNKVHYAIYLNIGSDAGYVTDYKNQALILNNYMLNQFLYSQGIGLDLVTYYDNVFSFSFFRNRYGETGFFMHFHASI